MVLVRPLHVSAVGTIAILKVGTLVLNVAVSERKQSKTQMVNNTNGAAAAAGLLMVTSHAVGNKNRKISEINSASQCNALIRPSDWRTNQFRTHKNRLDLLTEHKCTCEHTIRKTEHGVRSMASINN